MKKIRLPQPYASMVIAGALNTIPNLWTDVKYGEKIFIYAEEVAPECQDGDLDYSNPLNRKIFNESFLGNIPDIINDFPTNKFIGYVRVYNRGTIQEGWVKPGPILFVTSPHKFCNFKDDFNTEINFLDTTPSRSVTLKRIKRVDSKLYVPVGKSTWQRLKDPEECWKVCMFWEKYMEAFAVICFSNEEKFSEYVTDIYFKYRNNTIHFGTGIDIGQNYTGNHCILDFNLEYRYFGNTLLNMKACIEEAQKERETKREREAKSCGDDENYEYKAPYVRIIFTPMGGSTRWKRR